MATLTGANLIAGRESTSGTSTFTGIDPAEGASLDPPFVQATEDELAAACEAAFEAYQTDRKRPAADRAGLLEAIAREIDALGDSLVERVTQETALPPARVVSERGRTTAQLRMFADLVRSGAWRDARVDHAEPERTPLPKPDIRRILIPIGPVAVFGASNFPLAFSVAGGDTASALAAGCPVVVKAHPAHPGTSELVGRAIARAVADAGFHPGTFSLLHGPDPTVSLALVRHPRIRAVGFTGSLRAGRALFDAAAARPEPITVFAEMGSVNPVFLLPEALAGRRDDIVRGLVGSVTLGAGQFCTKPGLVFVPEGPEVDSFVAHLGEAMRETPAFTLLAAGIAEGYQQGVAEVTGVDGVAVAGASEADGGGSTGATGRVFVTDAKTFQSHARLHEEVFGPATLVVRCASREELLSLARALDGSLTATIHGTEAELKEHLDLVDALEDRAGRLVFNGYPTGVEVCHSMHHGGPYPATTDVRSTSVGTAAIYRFARPICYQNFPREVLPQELQD